MKEENSKTVISHFYNEEYLLPWWLNHHKKIFDHGILIDYDSTDDSVKICKEICPDWLLVKSVNKMFIPWNVDREVEKYEASVNGWKIALNTTEFLVGPVDNTIKNTELDQLFIPSVSFFDWDPDGYLDENKKLWKQKFYGIDYETVFEFRLSRSFHKKNIIYPTGRHFNREICKDLLIFHYANCISSKQMLERRLQIQNKIPESEKKTKRGLQHHNSGKGLTADALYEIYKNLLNKSMIKDQTQYIKLIENNYDN